MNPLIAETSSWVWPLLSTLAIALAGSLRYGLRLLFLWGVFKRGGNDSLEIAGKVTPLHHQGRLTQRRPRSQPTARRASPRRTASRRAA